VRLAPHRGVSPGWCSAPPVASDQGGAEPARGGGGALLMAYLVLEAGPKPTTAAKTGGGRGGRPDRLGGLPTCGPHPLERATRVQGWEFETKIRYLRFFSAQFADVWELKALQTLLHQGFQRPPEQVGERRRPRHQSSQRVGRRPVEPCNSTPGVRPTGQIHHSVSDRHMQACPSCSAELASDSRFCAQCGTPVAAREADAEGELRQLTALFCGL
jgi:zinc-ribbon domain